jgi:tape measure domain-containing protein
MAVESVVNVRVKGSVIDFEQAVARIDRIAKQQQSRFAADQRRQVQLAKETAAKADLTPIFQKQTASIQSLRGELVKLAPALAAAFSVSEATAAADTWTRFNNSLAVAGLEGAKLAAVQDALYASAQKNGIQLESLGVLFGRASQAAGELGASQSQLLQFTDGITNALRVQGGSAASASGALLQLSQALGAGTVRAEEFNSINEGARPILEAVAQGSDRFGGSVAKLRAAVMDGTVSSKEFFQAFLAGASMLEEKAAKTALTVDASMTKLQNALVKYVGETDASLGATERLSQGLQLLAENLDSMFLAITVVGAAMTGRMVAPMIRAQVVTGLATVENMRYQASLASMAVAQGTMTASAVRATTAMTGLRGAMAFLGGPWTIAITAIGAALGYLAIKNMEAKKASSSLEDTLRDVDEALKATEWASKAASVATEGFAEHNDAARKLAESLTGQLGELADKYYEVAAAAKTAAINELMAKNASLETAISEQRAKIAEKRNDRTRLVTGPREPGALGAAGGLATLGIDPGATANVSRETAALNNLLNAQQDVLTRVRELNNTAATDPHWGGAAAIASVAGKPKGKGAGKSGPTAEELAAKRDAIQLDNEIALARERNDTAELRRLEFKKEQIGLINSLKEAGLKQTEAESLAESFIYAKKVAQLEAARKLAEVTPSKPWIIDPSTDSTFKTREERLDPLDDAIRSRQDELRDTFKNALRGGLEAGFAEGFPGIAEYISNTLRQRLLDNLINVITDGIFPQGGFGANVGGGWGMFSSASNFLGKIFGGHATGTSFSPGGWKMIGENGPELMRIPVGSQVFSNSDLRNSLSSAGNSGAVNTSVNIYTTVNADNSLVKEELQSMMIAVHQSAVTKAQSEFSRSMRQRNMKSLQ